ncbi:type II toxin-antitoxin system HipA family toxin [Desulfovibrio aminophilus]|nr:type II toxin-antitoxin system HipA family toxin [Desulfovibrio aminophilus]MCM0754206.1 type II toxin-antitoxin system HipA family toxin [Desulfovibrio aminophilus]
MSREILVFINLAGVDHRVGTLWAHAGKGRESATFEYAADWRASPLRFSLDPALAVGEGQFQTPAGRALFGAIGDSAPDTWGRALLRRRENHLAKAEKRAARALLEVDFLLLVDDALRGGALRFKEKADGAFSAHGGQVPPLLRLGDMLAASDRVVAEQETSEDLRLLLEPGASLGGARPKASVLDAEGRLHIAKFPKSGDPYDVPRWEEVVLRLAENAGIRVAKHRLENVAGRHVLLVQRFDRDDAGNRIPYLSAMSMLGAEDGQSRSYFEIVESLYEYGAEPERDTSELWRRMVFNILVSNVDDHLRNHGFLHVGAEGWELAPAFDLEITPADIKNPVNHQTSILPGAVGDASVENALQAAPDFLLSLEEARTVLQEVSTAVGGWRRVAQNVGLGSQEIDRMASAFGHGLPARADQDEGPRP